MKFIQVKPILFSEAMVRGLIEGRKTQTRRCLYVVGVDLANGPDMTVVMTEEGTRPLKREQLRRLRQAQRIDERRHAPRDA